GSEAGDGGGGSALVATGKGSGGGGASEYGPYLAQWRRRIHDNLRYPLAARRRNLTGTVKLDIVIQSDGSVVSVAVAESSSHSLLHEAAVESLRSLSPPPLSPHP